jgi:hypothetical protein
MTITAGKVLVRDDVNPVHWIGEQGRFLLGLGSQVRRIIQDRFSAEFDRPARRMAEYVQAMRAVWAMNRGQAAKLVGLAPINRDSGSLRGKRMIGGGRTRRSQGGGLLSQFDSRLRDPQSPDVARTDDGCHRAATPELIPSGHRLGGHLIPVESLRQNIQDRSPRWAIGQCFE